jgi:hypothetical protein
LQEAEAKLVSKAERMRVKLSLPRSSAEIVNAIKDTLEMRVGSQNQTVSQILYDRERGKAFNELASDMYPDEYQEHREDIFDLLEESLPTRKKGQFASNAWKWDPDGDRRAREGSTAPYKGRPQLYDPDVLSAFADAIALAAQRPRFAVGHHGDDTLGDDLGSPMFQLLVAAVQWAVVVAWLSAAPPETAAPIVKPEGIRNALKRPRCLSDAKIPSHDAKAKFEVRWRLLGKAWRPVAIRRKQAKKSAKKSAKKTAKKAAKKAPKKKAKKAKR